MVRHLDPMPVHKHFQAAGGQPVGDWPAIMFIAAALAPSIYHQRVDVMGLGQHWQAEDEDSGNKSGKHADAPELGSERVGSRVDRPREEPSR